MANVIKTVLTYQLDGSNRDFNIPFEYLARKFVVVTLIGVDRKFLTINTDYRFATRTTISLTKAWGPADGYTTIELRRVTSTTDRLVDFTDGSILRAYDLNVAQIQTMHVAEEARDLTADTIGVNNDGHLDARGRRIVNLANAVDDRDAVPFGQLKTMNQNSWQARNEALQFRNEAETFRNQAEGFKNESSTNATNTNQWRNEAEGFRNEAEQFKTTAGQHATSAGNSAAAAHQSEVNSGNSATASANSAHSAEQQADRAKLEADKLGNMNDFAGTIKSVDVETSHITFKGPLETDSGITTHGASAVNSLTVSKDAVIEGDSLLHSTTVDGNLNVNHTMSVVGDSWLHKTTVDGNLNVNRTMSVGGDSLLHSTTVDGNLNVNHTMSVVGDSWLHKTTVDGNLNVNRGVLANGDVASYSSAPANPNTGDYLNTHAIRVKLRGRGAFSEPDGAYGGLYLQEVVGTSNRLILNLNGFGRDSSWQFLSGGKIGTPYGEVQTAGSDIRIKTEVGPAPEGAGERIDGIGIVEYTEIGTGRRRRGWIAQQVDTVDPMYAYLSEGLLNTDDRAILADLITTVQELRQRVAELEDDKERRVVHGRTL